MGVLGAGSGEGLRSLVDWLEDLGWDLPAELLDLEFIEPVFLILLLDLLGDLCELRLESLDRFFLTFHLFPKLPIFNCLFLLGDPKVSLQLLQVFSRVGLVHLLNTLLFLSELRPFLLLLLDHQCHLSALLLQCHQCLVLDLHTALVFPLLVLQLAEMLLGLL